MDLCCLIDSEERLSATDLVTMLGDLLERGSCIGRCLDRHNTY
jgi:terminal uridylyltransferase